MRDDPNVNGRGRTIPSRTGGIGPQNLGAFTLGVEVIEPNDNVVVLELDLADCDELPWDFKQR